MEHYTHLSMSERRQFYLLLEMGLSIGAIAKKLSRHRSSLYRELKRNTDQGEYLPGLAQEEAQKRIRFNRTSKLQRDPALYDYVISHLKEGWSPEQISGRMKVENKNYYACYETIYQYIYRPSNKGLYVYLPYQKPKRRRYHARKPQRCRYGEIRSIIKRPAQIGLRTHFGHWEGDIIEFHATKKYTVTTLVERKSRWVHLIKNQNKISRDVMRAIREKFQADKPTILKTITFDQGGEFSDYRQIEMHIPCKTYYCDVQSPWLKGSNENMNGRLRRYLPQHASIQYITQQQLDLLAKKMNNLPRKCLGFKKPKELISKAKEYICRTSK